MITSEQETLTAFAYGSNMLTSRIRERCPSARPLGMAELVNMVTQIIFAGHETTAGQAAWNIILLLQNPDYLALVQEEVDRVAVSYTHLTLPTSDLV